MDGAQIKKHVQWLLDQALGEIRHEYKADLFALKSEFNGFKSLFEIKDLIGEGMPYPSITDYLKATYENNSKFQADISSQVKDIEKT